MTTDPPSLKRARAEAVSHDANDVLQFLFPNGVDGQDDEGYNPAMCHQVFGEDEVIEGHPDPSVSVRFSPQFHSLLEWSSGGKPAAAGATDIPGAMAEALGDGMATTEEAFQRLVAEEGALDPAALGTPVDWRRVLDEPGAGPAPPAARNLNIYASHLSSAHEQLRGLHARLQPLLLFYVDAASMIDQDDPDWELLLAVVDSAQGEARVAGFATVFNFFAWPEGRRVRVSQVFVLPPYQRAGVGSALLAAAAAHAQTAAAVDVTYEDPTEELQRLRDRLDCGRARKRDWFVRAAKKGATELERGKGEGDADGVPKQAAEQARRELGLCKQQAQRVWEVLVYEALARTAPDAADEVMAESIRRRMAAAVAAAEEGAKDKATRDTDAGFVMQRVKRSRTGGAPAVPTAPVEEGTAESKAEAVEKAAQDRLEAVLAVAQA